MEHSQWPSWFHAHGFKMEKGGGPPLVVVHGPKVLIGNNVAYLLISPQFGQIGSYRISWRITFFQGDYVEGRIHVTAAELRAAFGISEQPCLDNAFADHFLADSAVQGHYIRRGNFLNIPMPGTGTDGDPNISIYLDDEIKQAVRDFLAA